MIIVPRSKLIPHYWGISLPLFTINFHKNPFLSTRNEEEIKSSLGKMKFFYDFVGFCCLMPGNGRSLGKKSNDDFHNFQMMHNNLAIYVSLQSKKRSKNYFIFHLKNEIFSSKLLYVCTSFKWVLKWIEITRQIKFESISHALFAFNTI